MKEAWKDIVGYEGLYQISNKGRLKHLKSSHVIDEHICKCYINNNGYYIAHLYKNNERKMFLLHRLVATAFIENTNNYEFVNHINSKRTDCRAENLEWCDRSYNTKWSYKTNDRRGKMNWKSGANNAKAKAIFMKSKDGKIIKKFDCIMDAQRELGIPSNNIVACLKGRYKTSGGYLWDYVK